MSRSGREAAVAQSAYRRGESARPLEGLPIAVKDLFDRDSVRTTYGSPIFSGHVPAEDAAAVRRAREAGAILIGKTQTHEFAWGISSVNELMGTSRNPWALDRVSGGSSGGSALALASHLAPLALGSDTGGSIRVPSNFCGTVGLKPSYGRVSAGGPGHRNEVDALLSGAAGDGLHGARVGLCSDLQLVPLAAAIERAFQAAGSAVQRLGGDGQRRTACTDRRGAGRAPR